MATTRNLVPPSAIGNGPTMLIPDCEKGYADVIDVIPCFGFLEGSHHGAQKVPVQESKDAGDASTPLDVDSDPDTWLKASEIQLLQEIDSLRQDMAAIVTKVFPDTAMKLVHSDEMYVLIVKLVREAIINGRCVAFEEVVKLNKPFILEKMPDYYTSSKEEMDNSNITMEEYIRLEEEKAQKRGTVFNWETAKYDPALKCHTPYWPTPIRRIDYRSSYGVSISEYVVSTLRTECLNSCTSLIDFIDMAPLPPRDQSHLWLHYQVEGYTEEIVHDFELRLKTIFERQLGRARRSMTWRQIILALGLHSAKEMAEDGFNAYWLGTQYLFRNAERRKSDARLSGGYFIGRLAHHFGLVSDDGLRGLSVVTCKLPLIDMGGAEDASDIDEGAQAILAPIHAPHHHCQLQGRFSTWMISCMTQLMKASRRTYQAFDGTFRGSYPKEMRIRSPNRLLGFPIGFPLGMVPPKNLDKRNNLFPHDSVLTIYNGLRGHTISWKEIRIRSSDRLLGFPSGFPLGMVPPKNLDKQNPLFPHDSVLTIYNGLRAAASVSATRHVNTAASRSNMNSALPTTYSYFKAHSPVRRPFNQKSAAKTNNFNEKVNTAKDQGIFDSGCSRHMTGNKSYLTDYQEIDGGFFVFGGNAKGGKITGKGRKPAISFMRPFGCPVTILNTLDHLGRKSSVDEVANDAGKKSTEDQEEALRKQFKQASKRLFAQGEAANTNSTNRLNTVSSPVNAVSSFFTTVDPGKERAQRNEFKKDTTDLKDSGIFSGAYDDEVEDP
uniref:Retrovirus-related Pol polyprotein from transposon TNT 1-94-like beta-barrel domain-containing protein n=1 Tax=Tanacetum cinerariifolium TaxID=118510 RepID=A0A699GKU1_TANCI|nr:hypothetical protein [Tanacetum cinerariifolium]